MPEKLLVAMEHFNAESVGKQDFFSTFFLRPSAFNSRKWSARYLSFPRYLSNLLSVSFKALFIQAHRFRAFPSVFSLAFGLWREKKTKGSNLDVEINEATIIKKENFIPNVVSHRIDLNFIPCLTICLTCKTNHLFLIVFLQFSKTLTISTLYFKNKLYTYSLREYDKSKDIENRLI